MNSRKSQDYGSPGSYERMGADGTRVFVCSICYRIEVSSYDGWLYHLGTREHQEKMKRSRTAMTWRGSPAIRSRVVVLRGIEGKTSWQMLDFLKLWGEVEDFQYEFHRAENGKARHCLCLFKDLDSAIACVAENGNEWEGKKLEIYFQRQKSLSEQISPERRKVLKRKMEDSLYSGP